MGAEPYFYFVKYQPDLAAALEELRQREFQAGRYNPAMDFLAFPIDPNAPSPGAQHDSIEEALEESDADGTRSILDLDHTSLEPDFGAVTPLSASDVEELYGTPQPTRAMLEHDMGFFENVERGHGISVIVFKDGKPDEILFAGYSYD